MAGTENGYRIRVSAVNGRVQYQVVRRAKVLGMFNTRTEAKKFIDRQK